MSIRYEFNPLALPPVDEAPQPVATRDKPLGYPFSLPDLSSPIQPLVCHQTGPVNEGCDINTVRFRDSVPSLLEIVPRQPAIIDPIDPNQSGQVNTNPNHMALAGKKAPVVPFRLKELCRRIRQVHGETTYNVGICLAENLAELSHYFVTSVLGHRAKPEQGDFTVEGQEDIKVEEEEAPSSVLGPVVQVVYGYNKTILGGYIPRAMDLSVEVPEVDNAEGIYVPFLVVQFKDHNLFSEGALTFTRSLSVAAFSSAPWSG